jgi:hypothetical protein
MKAWILVFCMAAATALQLEAADWVYTVKIDFSGTPADGDKITANGVDRVFKTAVSSPSTQVAISSNTNTMAANLYAQLQTYRFTGISSHQWQGTVTLIGTANVLVTASKVGSWGTLTVSSNALTMWTVIAPGAMLSATSRGPIYNALVDSISTIPTNRFSATAPALANFANLSQVQTFTGAKTFAAANVYSNASQIFTLGNLSNAIARAIKLKQAATLSGIYMLNSSDAAIYTIAPDAAGRPTIKTLTGDTLGTGPTYSPNADDILSRAIADNYYGRLAQDNHWTGVQSFDSIDGANIDGPVITSGDISALVLKSALSSFSGHVGISNAAPTLSIVDTDAGANLKWWKWKADGSGFGANALKLFVTPDDGSEPVGSTVLEITRNNTSTGTSVSSDTQLIVYSPTKFEGAVELVGGSLKNASVIESSAGFVAGALDVGIPSGASGAFYAVDGSGPIADPATGWIMWSELGKLMYRSSAANEGSGQANHAHNRTATITAAGTPYSLTSSTAFIDVGTTDPKITLPTAGTFLIFADVSFTTGTTANDDYRFKLRNETTSTDVSGSDFSTTEFGTTSVASMAHLEATVTTTTASNVIAIWGHNNTAARGTVTSDRTRISYVRLY